MFFTNGGTVTLLITRGIPFLYRDIRVVETSQFSIVQIMSGSRFPLSVHPYDPLLRITRMRVVLSERKSAHLSLRQISKFNPITVKPLIVRGYQKHPSTLTNFLPEEHSIHTRDIYQDIGNCHAPFDLSYLFCWSKSFIYTRLNGKLSHNLQVSQVYPQSVLLLSICRHHD